MTVVLLELGREFFALLVLNVHFAEVDFELAQETVDRRLVLLLYLLYLPFITLLHLKALLFQL